MRGLGLRSGWELFQPSMEYTPLDTPNPPTHALMPPMVLLVGANSPRSPAPLSGQVEHGGDPKSEELLSWLTTRCLGDLAYCARTCMMRSSWLLVIARPSGEPLSSLLCGLS